MQQNTFIKDITVKKTGNVMVSKNVTITNVQNVHAIVPVTRIANTKVTTLSSLATRPGGVKIENRVIKVEPVTMAQRTEIQKAVVPYRATAQHRHVVETKSLVEGRTPVKNTDVSRTVKIELPKVPVVKVEHKTIEVKPPPRQPELPKHEERNIPRTMRPSSRSRPGRELKDPSKTRHQNHDPLRVGQHSPPLRTVVVLFCLLAPVPVNGPARCALFGDWVRPEW